MADFNLNATQVLAVLERQVGTANYRARNVGLSDHFTIDQWLTILNHWHWRCAICDTSSRDLSPDHWLPLSHEACPGSTYDNIVPLCEGCNLSKNRTEPIAWLTRRFGDEIANEKIAKVRQSFQELTTPGHPYNTTIPEKAWVSDPPAESTLRRLCLVFDMAIPAERDIWATWNRMFLSSEEKQIYIKNVLYVANTVSITPLYPTSD